MTNRTYSTAPVLTTDLLAQAEEQMRVETARHASALLMTPPANPAGVGPLTGPEAPQVAVDLVRALHGHAMTPHDPHWWSSPLGVVCSTAIAQASDEQAAALPPVSLAEAGRIMGTSKGTASQLRARGRLPRPEGSAPNAHGCDARTVHTEAARLRGQRAAGYDRTSRPDPRRGT